MAANSDTVTMNLTLSKAVFARLEKRVTSISSPLASADLQPRPLSRPDVVKAALGRYLDDDESSALEALSTTPASAVPLTRPARQRLKSISVPQHSTCG